jgi:hypothetical protein
MGLMSLVLVQVSVTVGGGDEVFSSVQKSQMNMKIFHPIFASFERLWGELWVCSRVGLDNEGMDLKAQVAVNVNINNRRSTRRD